MNNGEVKMKPEEFQNIKDKIENAKNQKALAEGALAQLMTQLKNDFGLDTVEAAKLKLAELSEEIVKVQSSIQKLFADLEQVTNWDSI